MSTKLFVGGLPWAMDNQRLKEVFAEFGDVEEARVVLDRETGRSRGFGFVTFTTPEAAEKALGLDGQEIDGRPIRIDRATEKQRPARGGGGGAGGPPGRSRDGAGPEGGAGAGRREFSDDGGGGGKPKSKVRGRRRGGRGARGGGSDGGDGSPSGGRGYDE